MASSRTREGLYWILGNISSLEGCSGNGTGWSVEFPSLEMFKGCVDVVFRGLAVLGQQLGPCPTVTCREGLVPRQQPVIPSLPGALCALLGGHVPLCFLLEREPSPGSDKSRAIWQLQALELCSCSALSQGGRDVTLPGTLLASHPCCFLPYPVWIY